MKLNKMYCEDCLETMSRMKDNFIDLTVTSPPYDNLRTYNDNIDETWGEDVWKPIIKELYRVTKEGGVVVWVVGDATINGSESGVSFHQALYAKEVGFNLHDTMIYSKQGFSNPSSNRYHQVFEYMFIFSKAAPKTFNPIQDKINNWGNTETGNTTSRQKNGDVKETGKRAINRFGMRYNIWKVKNEGGFNNVDSLTKKHPATYPQNIPKDHIKSWSNESDLVYDPFMGSGTTAKMAHLLKRNWIGSELSQEYVDLANKRLEPYLNQTTLF